MNTKTGPPVGSDRMDNQLRGIYRTQLIACLLLAGWIAQLAPAASNAKAFRVTQDSAGKCWLVDPQGSRFLSLGVNNIRPEPWRPTPGTQFFNPLPTQYNGNLTAWKEDVWKLLQEHGLNTLGAWSDGGLYDGPLYGTVCLYVASYAADRCLEGLRPGFADRVKENTQIMLDTYPHLDNVFGVFLDNEMPWFGHGAWGDVPNHTLLEVALNLPAEDEARRAAVRFLQSRYDSPEALSSAWGKPLASWDGLTFAYARSCVSAAAQQDRADFVALAAEAFYKTACETVRQILPGKLILGTRYAEYAPQPVIEACGRHCDIISFNHYTRNPQADRDLLARYWIWGGQKPLIVTEFSWRAEENTSGNPNSGGAGGVVKTQAQRAQNYSRYVEDLLACPMVVGAHWFEFADQSPQGRFDGENSNYGIVDIHNRPYTELLTAMKQTNEAAKKLHADSPRQAPESLPKPKAVTFEPGQYPGRPPAVDLLEAPVKGPEIFHAADASLDIKQTDKTLIVQIDTGSDWGGGVSFYGPAQFKNSSGPQYSTNLGGYTAIEIDATIPKDVFFDFYLDEAGVGPANAPSYDSSCGDDCESFTLPALQGVGSRHTYRLELADLQPRTNWGSQKGLRKIDVASLKGVALYFHGGQGTQQIRLFSMKLVR